jgi:fucokinase
MKNPQQRAARRSRLWSAKSRFSAADLAQRLAASEHRGRVAARLLSRARCASQQAGGTEALAAPRVLHALASAVSLLAGHDVAPVAEVLPELIAALRPADFDWLRAREISPQPGQSVGQWCEALRQAAFALLSRAIVTSGQPALPPATVPLRSDEIVWGRAPARLDLCGGWTDTPPYALEFGGAVLNAAVNLNGQAPIQVFARVIDEPLVRITSIDRGARLEIRNLDELHDYRDLHSESSLVKTALVLSGIARSGPALPDQLRRLFGGGVELTTLAAVPKGSGLGTSSILGAVLLAVLDRVVGRTSGSRELFHRVLRLEQILTTGGGWQDQIGGMVDGVKLITTGPGAVPDPDIQFVPADVLDPSQNGGLTLLYYTGLTRLAKNILQRVVGRYLDRDPATLCALDKLHELAPQAAVAAARRDMAALGQFVDAAWTLNKQLDPESSNAAVEAILAQVRPHVHGAKLLGAGGGGFLFLVCKSPDDAVAVRKRLEHEPPNPRARFFAFSVNGEGLRITAC